MVSKIIRRVREHSLAGFFSLAQGAERIPLLHAAASNVNSHCQSDVEFGEREEQPLWERVLAISEKSSPSSLGLYNLNLTHILKSNNIGN